MLTCDREALKGVFFKSQDEQAKNDQAIKKRNARIVDYISKRLTDG